jgi:hypothetical protein
MTRHLTGLALGVALTLAFAAAGVCGKDDKEKEDEDVVAARKDVVDLTTMVKEGKGAKAVAAKVKAIRAKHDDLILVMKVFKLKEKGGLGIGPKPDPKDGIEKRLEHLASNKTAVLGAIQLKAQSAELIEMAHVGAAMAELVKPYFHKPVKGNNRRVWDRHADRQKRASDDLIKAVRAGNGLAVKRAAADMVKACNDCHSDFR